ncbi:MAG: hypothetical protein LUD02_02815 [Tannerellaceae bacterium]|nr:hypothetical protein [Tannerellaceae bacterium]MCD8263204.1 hypothetical protein [Tannerellaceae bacterium]
MKIRNELIKYAITELKKEIAPEDIYKGVYKGYISSFGAAIIQSGLLPAVLTFEQKNENTQADRSAIIRAIINIIDANRRAHNKTTLIGDQKLAEYILAHKDEYQLINEVEEAAIALKLALRMFKKREMMGTRKPEPIKKIIVPSGIKPITRRLI